VNRNALNLHDLRCVDGDWAPAQSSDSIDVHNAATEEIIVQLTDA
jgi:hypothetical protein